MPQELYEKCRKMKETSNPRITNQDLAEATGKSERTVAQFLRGEIPNASCETVASICREFGVSVDEHYGIAPPKPSPDEKLTEEIHALESECHALTLRNVELTQEVAHQKEKADFLRTQLKARRPVIYSLMCVSVTTAFALLIYIILDVNVPGVGFIRHGQFSAAAWIVIVLIIISTGVIAWSIIHAVRRPKKVEK